MIKQLIVAAVFLVAGSAAALAQSSWTTGTAANRAAAGYATPYGQGYGLYNYSPGFSARAHIGHRR